MSIRLRPLQSLQEGRWFKLICGASYQHLPAIRNLALAYGLAGADCIDVAADPTVVKAVKEAFKVISSFKDAEKLACRTEISPPSELPLLMVSFSDGEDPHFRKAIFDATVCPADCPRPCESICPASAISFGDAGSGVVEDRCYGCGRCLPVCPIQQIDTVTRATSPQEIAPQLLDAVDAIELHTQVGRYESFMSLWSVIQPYLSSFSLISISCPEHDGAIDYLWRLYEGIQPLSIPLIWQTDGRPMSGDIGNGTTHATLKFGQKVLQSGPPGFVQLAGGTNAHTVSKLHQMEMPNPSCNVLVSPLRTLAEKLQPTFGGIAYGSFARHLMSPLLDELSLASLEAASISGNKQPANHHVLNHLEASPTQLVQAVQIAQSLVTPLKQAPNTLSIPSLESVKNPCSRVEAVLPSPSYPSLFE
ncbi:MAG: 4Fe-4S ferredoxin [Leptolyngbya sp. SIO1D8]|nr:4Fe-4S ferredoxin [Leptolyngbya sp. SIO1D8]